MNSFSEHKTVQVRAFNPKYKEAEGALIGEFQRFHTPDPAELLGQGVPERENQA